MEYYSCGEISAFHFVINGNIDFPAENHEGIISFCCRQDLKKDIDGSVMNFPASPLDETPIKTLQQFILMHNKMLDKGQMGGGRRYSKRSKVCLLLLRTMA